MFNRPQIPRMLPMNFPQISQQELPAFSSSQYMPINENFSNYSGTTTATGLSYSSLYMANQKKKVLTDEIISCLNSRIENLLPSIAQKTAEAIYNAILPYIEKQGNQIKELQSQVEVFDKMLKSMSTITKENQSLKSLSTISNSLTTINSNIENCNIVLQNQVAIEQANFDYKQKQNEKMVMLKQKMEMLKTLLIAEKNKVNDVNSNINRAYSDIIGLRRDITQEIGKINQNLQFGKVLCSNNHYDKESVNELEKNLDNLYDNIQSSKEVRVVNQKKKCGNVGNENQMEKENIKSIFKNSKFSF